MTRARVLLAFVALCVLAGVSFGASFLHLGAFGVPFALAIASLKVAVVAAIFMELTHTRHSIAFTGATALAFITLLTGLVVTERETRVDDVAAAPDRARVDAAAAPVTERETRTDDVSVAAPAVARAPARLPPPPARR